MNPKEGKTRFYQLTELFGGIQIVLTPTLIGALLGGTFYLYSPNRTGIVIGIIFIGIGILLGIIWATRIKKKYGTIWFISRNIATPELDTKNEPRREKKKEK